MVNLKLLVSANSRLHVCDVHTHLYVTAQRHDVRQHELQFNAIHCAQIVDF